MGRDKVTMGRDKVTLGRDCTVPESRSVLNKPCLSHCVSWLDRDQVTMDLDKVTMGRDKVTVDRD